MVQITVLDVNRAPTVSEMSVRTREDTVALLKLSGSDPDGDPVTFHIEEKPVNGTLSGKGPDLSYKPKDNFHGSDFFTYTLKDGFLISEEARVSIDVISINDAPKCTDVKLSTPENQSLTHNLSPYCSDDDGDFLELEIVTKGKHGGLKLLGPVITYTPKPRFRGQDSFTFRSKDGRGALSNRGTVTIEVTPAQ